MRGYAILALITVAYMVAEYFYRGYFAIGAEIMFAPIGIMVIHYIKEMKQDE